MAFGQPAGPPASPRQLEELRALVEQAGHADFRDARGPLGLNQRQAAGRFTRAEAAALIEQLGQLGQPIQPDCRSGAGRARGAVSHVGGAGHRADPSPADPSPAEPVSAAALRVLRDVPSAHLAAELQRRGWLVLEP